MIRKFFDLIFTSLFFSLTFFISYEIVNVLDVVSLQLTWYVFFIIGFLQTILFRIFGRLIGSKSNKDKSDELKEKANKILEQTNRLKR